MSVLDAVLRLLKNEEERLNRELAGITSAIAAFGKTYVNGKSAPSLAAGGRTRNVAVPTARSANGRNTRKVVSIKSKGAPSAVGGKKVAAVRKARSAKVKTAKKSA